jgi:membrane associated rhomboid family serine protease
MLIPWSTEREQQRTPYLTYVLVAVNTAIFTLLLCLGEEATTFAFLNFGFIPERLQVHTLITSMFLHGSLMHLGSNMLMLWVFGRHLEDVLGTRLYAVLYFSSGLAAIMLHTLMGYIFAKDVLAMPAIGASGCIAGVLGLFGVRFFQTRIKVFTFILLRPITFTVASGFALGLWFFGELVGGLMGLGASGGVASWAHIGGFFYGMAMALVLRLESEGASDHLNESAAEALRIGDWHSALERYAELVGQDPTDVEAHSGLAASYCVLGEEERSIDHYEEALGLLCKRAEPAQALLLYKEFRGSFPGHVAPAKLRYQIACARETAGEVAQAYQELSDIRQIQPAAPEASMALLKMAQISLHRLHRPQEALRLFYEFKMAHPDSIWTVAADDGMREAQQVITGPVVPQQQQRPAGQPVAAPAHNAQVVAAAAMQGHRTPFVPGVAATPPHTIR